MATHHGLCPIINYPMSHKTYCFLQASWPWGSPVSRSHRGWPPVDLQPLPGYSASQDISHDHIVLPGGQSSLRSAMMTLCTSSSVSLSPIFRSSSSLPLLHVLAHEGSILASRCLPLCPLPDLHVLSGSGFPLLTQTQALHTPPVHRL